MFSYPFELYKATNEAWFAMLKACEEAETSIDIEQYIFQDDEIGKKFISVFEEKLKKGVKIRMLVDMVGSFAFYNSEAAKNLEKMGAEIRFFNPISPWRIPNFTSWFFRNHKKTLCVDKKVGFTGGTGVGFHMAEWRDTTARLEGNVVKEIAESFEELWWHVRDRRLVTRIRNLRKSRQKRDFITNSPYFKKRFLYYLLIEVMRNAKKSIYLTNPYFIPDHRIKRVLRLAARRGVDVQILLPKHIDVKMVEYASHAHYDSLLKDGVKIFKYQPKVLHAKTAIIDGHWATFGSFNLDTLSFVYNFEANVVTIDPNLVKGLETHFTEDLMNSQEVLYANWQKRGTMARVKEFFGRILGGVL